MRALDADGVRHPHGRALLVDRLDATRVPVAHVGRPEGHRAVASHRDVASVGRVDRVAAHVRRQRDDSHHRVAVRRPVRSRHTRERQVGPAHLVALDALEEVVAHELVPVDQPVAVGVDLHEEHVQLFVLHVDQSPHRSPKHRHVQSVAAVRVCGCEQVCEFLQVVLR